MLTCFYTTQSYFTFTFIPCFLFSGDWGKEVDRHNQIYTDRLKYASIACHYDSNLISSGFNELLETQYVKTCIRPFMNL